MKNKIFFVLLFLIAAVASASVITAFKQLGPGINVNGGIASDPSSGRAGDLYFNTASSTYRYFDGLHWFKVASGDSSGVASLAIGDSISGGTYGSILYVDVLNNLAQDNANLNYDDVTPGLFVGGYINTATTFQINGSDALSVNFAGQDVYVGNTMPASLTSTTAVGVMAGEAITTGNSNTLVGGSAGLGLITGSRNTFIGHIAGESMVSGSDNTFLGDSSGVNMTGTGNVGMGSISMSNGSGNYNVGVGLQALDNMTTGATNTGIGVNAGATITTGFDNTLIGRSSEVGTDPTISNATAIGANTLVQTSNTMILGSSEKVGINMITSTAWLNLPAGSSGASSAPLKIASGVLMNTPENGAIEYDGSNFWITNNLPNRAKIASLTGVESYLPFATGSITSIVANEIIGSGKTVRAQSIENVEASAAGFTCVGNPTLTLLDCGTSAGACTAGTTTLASVTIAGANSITDGTVSVASLPGGHYWAWQVSSGTCTLLNATGTAEATMY